MAPPKAYFRASAMSETCAENLAMIAAAVAEALRSNSKPATTFGQSSSSGSVSTSANTLTEEEEAEINAKLVGLVRVNQ